MQNVAKLPKALLVMEALGGLLIASALLVVNHRFPWPAGPPGYTRAGYRAVYHRHSANVACRLAPDVAQCESACAAVVQPFRQKR